MKRAAKEKSSLQSLKKVIDKLDFNSYKLINLLKDTGRMVKVKGQNTEYRAALELLRGTAWCLHQTLAKLSDLKERREHDLVSNSLLW